MATRQLSFWLRLGCMMCTLSLIRGLDDGPTCSDDDCDVEPDEGDRTAKYQSQADQPCPSPPPFLGPKPVDVKIHPMPWIATHHPHVQVGGTWRPDCQPRQKVAILVPYRDRHEDLLLLLNNIHPFMQAQLLEYTVYLVEQMDTKHFNKGSLLNIVFTEVVKHNTYDCIILQDIDKFPENTRNLYICGDTPMLMVANIRYAGKQYRKPKCLNIIHHDRVKQPFSSGDTTAMLDGGFIGLPIILDTVQTSTQEYFYKEFFGGVIAISPDHFQKTNGFSNMFWGWGSEDDDFYKRMHFHGLGTTRAPLEDANYMEIIHPYGFVNPRRHEVVKEGMQRYSTDGLNSLNYELVAIQKEALYTNISVLLLDADPYAGK